MDAKTCLEKLRLVGVLSFATVGFDGSPQIRCISAIHFDEESFYFFTARGKDFCKQLLADGRVQILAYTRFKEMIRVSARAVPVAEDAQKECIDTIFEEQPYLANVYPGDTRKIGIVFCVDEMRIEYFNLGVTPIFRETYTVGNRALADKGSLGGSGGLDLVRKGFFITEKCVGCGTCVKNCPQQAIDRGAGEGGKPFVIRQENCLHCGACFECCPVKAVVERGEMR